MISIMARSARGFFSRERADAYEPRAVQRGLWQPEQEAVEAILRRMPPGSSVLDLPVGTGRFLPACDALGLNVTGIDASAHMLEKARARSDRATLEIGDLFAIPAADRSFDLVLSVRIMHLIEHDDYRKAFAELSRVARGRMAMTLLLGDEPSSRGGPERARVMRRELGDWRIDSITQMHGDWHLVELSR